MAKTLDQIIARQDYLAINSVLKDRAIELAKIIHTKMKDIEVKEIGTVDCTVRIETRRANGFTDSYLAIKSSCDYYGYDSFTCHSLETDKSYYCAGDLNCWIERATSKEHLLFLNNVRDLLNILDEIENEKVAEINKALESTKDI